MKAILIDDEVHCLGTLEILLQKYCPQIEIIGKAQNGEDGFAKIKELKPELVFLDVEMPRVNGFEMLSMIDNIDFKIIFTTAYDNFAIKAFRVSAVDYLLKPIDRNELIEAVQKAVGIVPINENDNRDFYRKQVDSLLENIKIQSRNFPNLALPTLSGLEMVKVDNLIYLESDGNYTKVVKDDNSSILVSRTLKVLEEQLELYNFVRIHHSHLVNLDKISRYVQGDGGYVILENGQHLNVSRRKKNILLSKLKVS